jgi:hypothetical protein
VGNSHHHTEVWLTIQSATLNMRVQTKKADQCGRLGEKRIVVVLVVPSAPFGFSSLADCLNSLLIDVDDGKRIEPTLLPQPRFFGCAAQSFQLSGPVCAPRSVNREQRVMPARGRREMIAQNRGPPVAADSRSRTEKPLRIAVRRGL